MTQKKFTLRRGLKAPPPPPQATPSTYRSKNPMGRVSQPGDQQLLLDRLAENAELISAAQRRLDSTRRNSGYVARPLSHEEGLDGRHVGIARASTAEEFLFPMVPEVQRGLAVPGFRPCYFHEVALAELIWVIEGEVKTGYWKMGQHDGAPVVDRGLRVFGPFDCVYRRLTPPPTRWDRFKESPAGRTLKNPVIWAMFSLLLSAGITAVGAIRRLVG